MFSTVFVKCLRDQRRGLIGWSLGIVALVLLESALWPSISNIPGLRQMVDSGQLTTGVMKSAIDHGVEIVLAGSVRDDGPLPDVISDMEEAQRRMRAALGGVRIALMLSTMLHSIATGNMLPAGVRTVCVDINPAVVTKLADRGSWQSIGLVTDVESFLRELALVMETGRHG